MAGFNDRMREMIAVSSSNDAERYGIIAARSPSCGCAAAAIRRPPSPGLSASVPWAARSSDAGRPLQPARPASPAPALPSPTSRPATGGPARAPPTAARTGQSAQACAGSVPRTPARQPAPTAAPACATPGPRDHGRSPAAACAAGRSGSTSARRRRRSRQCRPCAACVRADRSCHAFGAEARTFGQRSRRRGDHVELFEAVVQGRLQRCMGTGNGARDRLLHRFAAQQERHHQ
ncbi:hypothetical protein G6F65_018389 [Rhizopus arrhizus]|nr:hypothetical protein G6F65_018389 [Rhizopus arrhizus]